MVSEGDAVRRDNSSASSPWSWRRWRIPNYDCDGIYTADSIPTEENGWTGRNYAGYRNPEMDLICAAIPRELDANGRRVLLWDSQRIFARDLPALPLYAQVYPLVTKGGLQNYSLGIEFESETWNAHAWYWQ